MEQLSTFDKAHEAAQFCIARTAHRPLIGLILGSGLGDFANLLEQADAIAYEDIPYFKKSTVHGHAGKLVFGNWQGVSVVAMQGRYHFYEGHSVQEVVFPVRVMKLLGINKLIVTNAAGGANRTFKAGDLMIITDHINLLGTNPLIGPNDERFGVRFPDQTNVWNHELREILKKCLTELNIPIKEGVYICSSGPTYETPSEVRMFQLLGGDALGMSTVPEAIVANHMGVKVVGLSCITNMACGISPNPLSHQEVMDTANAVKEQFQKLIGLLITKI